MKVANAKECDVNQNVMDVNKTTEALKKEPAKIVTENITMEEAMGMAEEEEPAAETELSQSTIDMMKKELENMEKSGEGFIDFAKLMEIARRIARGDKVPASDHKMLLEADPELYQSAKMQALLAKNKKPKEHDSLFEDEKEQEIKDLLNELKTENLSAAPVQDAGIQTEAGVSSGDTASASSGASGGEASVE